MILIAKDLFVIFYWLLQVKEFAIYHFYHCVSSSRIFVNSVLLPLLLAKIPNDEWNILQSDVKVMTKKFYFKRFFFYPESSISNLTELTMTFLWYTQSFVTEKLQSTRQSLGICIVLLKEFPTCDIIMTPNNSKLNILSCFACVHDLSKIAIH